VSSPAKEGCLGVSPVITHKKQGFEREVSETIAFLYKGSETIWKITGVPNVGISLALLVSSCLQADRQDLRKGSHNIQPPPPSNFTGLGIIS
jgi:hypothetical protein